MPDETLDVAHLQALEDGIDLSEPQTLQVLELPDDRVAEALELAHTVRMRWCGPQVDVQGIVVQVLPRCWRWRCVRWSELRPVR